MKSRYFARKADAHKKRDAATNMPACIMSCARPMLRRMVDFPPWFAPVIMTSRLLSPAPIERYRGDVFLQGCASHRTGREWEQAMRLA